MEWNHILEIARECNLRQLGCYVTVWAIENDVEVDTSLFDEKMNELYNKCTKVWESGKYLEHDKFYNQMCKNLV